MCNSNSVSEGTVHLSHSTFVNEGVINCQHTASSNKCSGDFLIGNSLHLGRFVYGPLPSTVILNCNGAVTVRVLPSHLAHQCWLQLVLLIHFRRVGWLFNAQDIPVNVIIYARAAQISHHIHGSLTFNTCTKLKIQLNPKVNWATKKKTSLKKNSSQLIADDDRFFMSVASYFCDFQLLIFHYEPMMNHLDLSNPVFFKANVFHVNRNKWWRYINEHTTKKVPQQKESTWIHKWVNAFGAKTRDISVC